MKVKVNLDCQIKNLSGKDLEGEQNHMGRTFAELLSVSGGKADSIRIIDACLSWNRKEAAEIDDTDRDLIFHVIGEASHISYLLKKQVIDKINDAFKRGALRETNKPKL